MMASTSALVLAIKLLFFAYLLYQGNTAANRITIRLGAELLYFPGPLAQSLTRLLWALIGPPVTSRRRMLRTTVAIVYPLSVTLFVLLRFLETSLMVRAIVYAKNTCLGLSFICFALVLANRIADLWDEQLRGITIRPWEILDVVFFLTIAMWSISAIMGIMGALRVNILYEPLTASELHDLLDWALQHRESLGWIYYIRWAFMEGVAHEFVLRGEVGPDVPD
jgi:hypothetical protein